MATEVLEIVVRQKGARVVARDIAKIAVSSMSANTALVTLNRTMATGATAATGLAKGAAGAAVAIGGVGVAAKRSAASLSTLGLGATLLGGAIVKGIAQPLANAVAKAAEFQSSINFAGVLSQVKRGSEEFQKLEDTAKELGLTTQFSATQAAEGLQFLAKAGFDVNDSIGALPGTLKIAAIANIGLGKASDITTNILAGFGQTVGDLPKAVDTLAGTVSSSNVDILQLAEAFKKVGPVAKQFQQTFVDVNAVIGQLGNAGIQGEESGTALRRIFINLENDVNKANSVLRKNGIAVRDAGGNFRSIISIFEDIAASAITPAERIDLFAARALASSGVLSDSAEKGLAKYAETLDNQVGRATEIAEARLFGLRGEGIKLSSAIEGLQLAIANSGLLDFVTFLAVQATKLVRAIANLPKPVLAAIAVLGTLASVAGVLTLQFGLAALAASALGLGLGSIGTGAAKAAAGVKTFTVALLTNPVTFLVAALVLAVAALVLFRNETFKIGDTTLTVTAIAEEAWDRLGNFVGSVTDNIITGFQGATDEAVDFADTIQVESTFSGLLSNTIAVFTSFVAVIRLSLKKAGELQGLFTVSLIESFLAIPKALKLAAEGKFSEAASLIGNKFKDNFVDSMDGFGDSLADAIFEEIQNAETLVNGALQSLGDSDFLKAAGKRVKGGGKKPPSTSDLGDGSGSGGGGETGDETFGADKILARATALQKLQASINPLAAANLEFTGSLLVLGEALKADVINLDQYNSILQELTDDTYMKLIAETNALVDINRKEDEALVKLAVAAKNAKVSLEELAIAQDKVRQNAQSARIRTQEFQESVGLLGSAVAGAQIAFEDFQKTPTEIFAQNFTRGLNLAQDALSEFIKTGEFNFKEFAKNILSLIADIIAQLLVQLAVEAALTAIRGSSGSGGGAATGALLGGVGGGAPGRAAGGPVQAGNPFIVGEEGPELFVPKTTGTVVPNDQLARGGAAEAAPVNVSVVNVSDPNEIPDGMDSRRGEQVILNTIQRNKRTVRDSIR